MGTPSRSSKPRDRSIRATAVPAVRSPRILLIEPNSARRTALRCALERDGYRVVEAPDGAAALAAQERTDPDVIVLNLVLPDMTGLELTPRLRLAPGGDAVPILAMSGLLRGRDATRVAAAGFSGLLLKPIDPAQVVQAVNAQMPAQGLKQAGVGQGRKILLAGDDPVRSKVVRHQLEVAGFQVRTADTGEQALRAARASVPDAVVSDVLLPTMDGFELCLKVRRDARLARVPLLLLSIQNIERTDLDLARRVGVTRLLPRPERPRELVQAVLDLLSQEVGPLPARSIKRDRKQPAGHLHRQLGRQISLTAKLAKTAALQATQLSLLVGMADTLSHGGDVDRVLQDLLPGCFEAAGISKGVLYLAGQNSPDRQQRNATGFSAEELDRLTDFFGCLPVLDEVINTGVAARLPSATIPAEITRKVLSGAGAKMALVVPLGSRERPVGALFAAFDVAAANGSVPVAFVRVLGAQIGQALTLAKSFSDLTRALAVRDDFLIIASHELRTPLTVARLGVESVSRTMSTVATTPAVLEELPRKITLIDRQLARLESLVDMLLDANLKDDEGVVLQRERTDLVDLVTGAIHSVGVCEGGEGALKISLRGEPSVKGLWDRFRIETVVTNLLSNAVKFSFNQPIEISIGQNGRCAVLSVTDHGIGIAPSDQKRLFEKFQRAVSTRNYGGWGVGLWLARRQVEAHGGTIHVESQLDGGATFIVELPIGLPATSEASLHH